MNELSDSFCSCLLLSGRRRRTQHLICPSLDMHAVRRSSDGQLKPLRRSFRSSRESPLYRSRSSGVQMARRLTLDEVGLGFGGAKTGNARRRSGPPPLRVALLRPAYLTGLSSKCRLRSSPGTAQGSDVDVLLGR